MKGHLVQREPQHGSGKTAKNGKLHKKREKVHKMINLSQIMITIKWKKGCKFAARIHN